MAKLKLNLALATTARLKLRLFEDGDAIVISELMTPDVSRWLSSWPANITKQETLIKISKYRNDTMDKRGLTVAIIRLEDNCVIGSLSVGVKPDNTKVGVIGYWIGEQFQGKGYLGEIINCFVNDAFKYLGIKTLEAGAQLENHASFAMMRKMGMAPIGKKSLYVPSRDRDEEVLYYALSRPNESDK
ncbi:GNAT family N-acetyltransferase [Kiloniella sp.]|uniref:GNAT family N-acetyltransferase n=1 Tax=Kiloniella sp. TaxID=1938587 RepID=UPI003B011908